MKRITSLCCLLLFTAALQAQERLGNYQVRVVPDKSDWTYELNQPARFHLSVTLDGHEVQGLPLKYACGAEAMPPTIEKSVTTSQQPLTVDAGTMKDPGFLRCVATVVKGGRTYRGLGTAGFRPDLIKPTTDSPEDFDAFWEEGKRELAKLPIDSRMERLPAYSTSTVDVFHVSFQNVGPSRPSRIYGILAIPKGTDPKAKFPAVLNVPGAGIRPYRGSLALTERGIITLQIGIHGIPVNLDQNVYDDLASGALNQYMFYGLENKDTYYYKRVILGCLRANDFLASLPQFDGQNLAVMGGSQGGALSVMTAALDPRVKGLAVWMPALSDQTGYILNRAGGWPHAFKDPKNRNPEKFATSKYYDTVNFARRVKVPGYYTFGYNDEICPPTSMFAAYNSITAPKQLALALETGHALTNEQSDAINKWI
ncbi:MAG TPA: acetylxylan esterase, partial [Pyrinomonadaceae bacterium]|nr:acetylxylan esterase [Pyrinomonadaceae bacterium]